MDQAYEQAKAQAESVAAMAAALECDYERRDELREVKAAGELTLEEGAELAELEAELAELEAELAELEAEAGDCENSEDAEQRVHDDALEICVRSGWYLPGDAEGAAPAEFYVLLCTGGPAVRIRGELNEHGEPDRAWIEYQDWGTPWTAYHGDGCTQDDLLMYCQQFYFGQ